jgi:hypothetical protein
MVKESFGRAVVYAPPLPLGCDAPSCCILLSCVTLPTSTKLTTSMAEETTTPNPEAPAKGDAKPKRDYKKEQKPIEELFDLSKPIPHVSLTVESPMECVMG